MINYSKFRIQQRHHLLLRSAKQHKQVSAFRLSILQFCSQQQLFANQVADLGFVDLHFL